MAQMKIKFYRQVPGALKFEVQYAEAEVAADPNTDDGRTVLDEAQTFLNEWAQDRKNELPETVLAELQAPRQNFGGPTGRGYGPVAAPPPRGPSGPAPMPGAPQAAPQAAWPGSQQQPQQHQAPMPQAQYAPPPQAGANVGFDPGYYEKCMAEIAQMTGKDRKDFERDFVRAASVVQKKDGTHFGSSANTLYELDQKSRAKRPDSTYPYETCERLGRSVAILRSEGRVTLTVPKWNRGSPEVARWDTPTYYAAGQPFQAAPQFPIPPAAPAQQGYGEGDQQAGDPF